MIIVQIKGGLGNQMFQYAAARQLSVKHGVPLKLDTLSFLQSETGDHTKRCFELDKFKIDAQIAQKQEIDTLKKKSFSNFIRQTYIRERLFGIFARNLKSAGNNCYLNGYWQNEKYFKEIDDIIRREFVFIEELNDDYITGIREQITQSEAVSVHFRRGDYVADKKINQTHGVCSMEYYQKAVEKIAQNVFNPVFFVFSDDIGWAKSHFRTRFPMVFVEKSDETQHSDFRLMSLCKHNIIANSSYSWWAAWLNTNNKKTVIAPQQWFSNKRKQRQAKHITPKEWMRI